MDYTEWIALGIVFFAAAALIWKRFFSGKSKKASCCGEGCAVKKDSRAPLKP